ncbi:NmrA-like family protein [Apiospora arundinis]|uniref:NmrA-like family protein n=1 Tax=Apiospora arundinis TaxID=335852 RepID=A0ABR2HQZ0_9PEZI
MADKKLITVFGATGNQGGSVVQTFLHDAKLKNEWSVRGVTRDVSKESSKKLAAQGVDVVSADLNDKASIVEALKGSYAVFAVTNYWEKMDDKLEIQQGKNLADAAKEAGVEFLIWSSLYNVNKLSKGALPHVYHFDSKATVEEYIRELAIPAAFFMPGFYMSNLPGGNFRKSSDGDNASWTLGLPFPGQTQIPMYHPGDTGKYIKAMVLNRDAVLGKRFLAATAYMTADDIVADFQKLFPAVAATTRYFEVPKDAFFAALKGAGMPDFGAEELYENMRLMSDFGYYGGDSLEWTHSFVEDPLTTWKGYAETAPAFAELK